MDIEPLWIGLAFILGFVFRQFSLPPLIGFLATGFLLKQFTDAEYNDQLGVVADAGVTLMIFTIGLKLDVKSLLRPHVWASATIHNALSIGIGMGALLSLGALGLPLVSDLDLASAALISFALSFSSTVFAVVMYGQSGDINANHGKLAIGVLIMQDIFAVAFMTAAKIINDGKYPSMWAVLLLLLIPLRKPLGRMLERSGHGELLVLSGLLIPMAVYQLFEYVNLKGDLGALIIGVLLASSSKAPELSKLLFGFKELFLVTFFLSIGLRGDPGLDHLLICTLLLFLLPLKSLLYHGLFTRFKVRARTSSLSTLVLSNYSEFGLIVATLGLSYGWISDDWLLIMALVLSASYVISAPITQRGEDLYSKFRNFLDHFETKKRLPEDEAVDAGDARILIFGMGTLGSSVYRAIRTNSDKMVLGVDEDINIVEDHTQNGRLVIQGEADDPDFWNRFHIGNVDHIVLTLNNHDHLIRSIKTLRSHGYRDDITVISRHGDECQTLLSAGASHAFPVYVEAANGLAQFVCSDPSGNNPITKRISRSDVQRKNH